MRRPIEYLVAILAAVLAAGCSEGTPVGPTVGELEVAAVTTGRDLDPDGYVIVMRGRTRTIGVNQTVTLADLTPGDLEVELTGVAPNCVVAESNPRTVRVSAGARASTSFSVACQELGTLEVATVTTGQDLDPDGYLLADEAGWRGWVIGVNDTLRIRRYPGNHSVELTGVAPNCAVTGLPWRSVEVPSGATVRITYEVACQAVVRPVLPGRIAFYSDRDGDFEIYLMAADGSAQTRLTTHPGFDGVPALSPDGTRILFETTRDGNSEIYLMNADGTEPVNLTDHLGYDERPSWSPDGTRILFVSDRDGPVDIFVMNADGSDPVNLTSNPAVDRPAAWSPDGSWIAFSSSRTGDFEIFVMDADGSNPVNLTNDPATVDFAPAWSPDGSRIAFTSRRVGEPRTDVVVMNADGSGRVSLTSDPATDDRWPSWSPDGAWIAFSTNRTGRSEVFVMRADGSDPFNVSNSPGSSDIAGWPQAWRP